MYATYFPSKSADCETEKNIIFLISILYISLWKALLKSMQVNKALSRPVKF